MIFGLDAFATATFAGPPAGGAVPGDFLWYELCTNQSEWDGIFPADLVGWDNLAPDDDRWEGLAASDSSWEEESKADSSWDKVHRTIPTISRC